MYNEEIQEGRRKSLSVCGSGERPSSLSAALHPPLQASPAPPLPHDALVRTALAYLAFFTLGGLVGVTGPSIPNLAVQLGDRRETQLGAAFTCRGAGYLTGSLLASFLETDGAGTTGSSSRNSSADNGGVTQQSSLPGLLRRLCAHRVEKHQLMVGAALLAGAATLAAGFGTSLAFFLALMFVQGLGLGGIDVAGNAMLVELWAGSRLADSLMQGLHACFGVGAVASPAAVGGLGFRSAFAIFAVIGALPLAVLLIDRLVVVRCCLPYVEGKGAPRVSEAAAAPACDYVRMDEEAVAAAAAPAASVEDQACAGSRSSCASPQAAAAASASTSAADGRDVGSYQQPRPMSPGALPQAPQLPAPAPSMRPLPTTTRLLISVFLFLYVGVEVAYGGWVASWLLLTGLTDSRRLASYSVSVFWSAITLGRLLAVPLAVVVRPRRFLLLQMGLLAAGVLLLLTLAGRSLPAAAAASAVFGLGMSAVFPVMMTLPSDLGYHLDMRSTGQFLVGSCLGEALLPVVMGECMNGLGTASFAWSVLVAAVVMWAIVAVLLVPTCGAAAAGEQGKGLLACQQDCPFGEAEEGAASGAGVSPGAEAKG